PRLPLAHERVLRALEGVIEPVVTAGGGYYQRLASTVGERRAQRRAPRLRRGEGRLFHDDEIQPDPSQAVRVIRRADGDGASAGQVDVALGFELVNPFGVQRGFQRAPGLEGEAVGRCDPPDAAALPGVGDRKSVV